MNLLIIVSGSVAIKKLPELIKQLSKKKVKTKCLITNAGMALLHSMNISLPKNFYYISDKDQFTKNNQMLHIDLSRKSDAILIFPASANIIGKHANGIADDLATTTLLASNKQIFIAPAMNSEMWNNHSNQINVQKLKNSGANFIGPIYGNLACGEIGFGRLSSINTITNEIVYFLKKQNLLRGLTGIITSGPTIEPIDSARFISNFSSGKQGYAIAKIMSLMGANIKLISGPTNLSKPNNVDLINVSSANEMNDATMDLLPADFAICTAAVADFRPKFHSFSKRKKEFLKVINLKRNPDILENISKSGKVRPSLVIGFSAETEKIKTNAKLKLMKKKCDWILANKLSKKDNVFGSDKNTIHYITKKNYEKWPKMEKIEVAKKLNDKIIDFFQKNNVSSN